MQNLYRESTTSGVCYDSDMVRKILTRASEIERSEPETLSVSQIEALGKELGLSPNAVRRAIGELRTAPMVAPKVRRLGLPLLTRRDIRCLLLPGIGLAIICTVALCALAFLIRTTGGIEASHYRAMYWNAWSFVMTYPAAILATFFGWRRSDFRLGTVAGLWSGICLAVTTGIMGGTVFSPNVAPQFYIGNYEVYLGTILFLQVIGAGVAGLITGWTCRWWDGLRRNEER